jgi:hypothetical protein
MSIKVGDRFIYKGFSVWPDHVCEVVRVVYNYDVYDSVVYDIKCAVFKDNRGKVTIDRDISKWFDHKRDHTFMEAVIHHKETAKDRYNPLVLELLL